MEENLHYVQDNMRKFGSDLADLILKDDRTKIFVCGDAKRMAVDVYQAFVDILVTHGGKNGLYFKRNDIRKLTNFLRKIER